MVYTSIKIIEYVLILYNECLCYVLLTVKNGANLCILVRSFFFFLRDKKHTCFRVWILTAFSKTPLVLFSSISSMTSLPKNNTVHSIEKFSAEFSYDEGVEEAESKPDSSISQVLASTSSISNVLNSAIGS